MPRLGPRGGDSYRDCSDSKTIHKFEAVINDDDDRSSETMEEIAGKTPV